jgi:DNA-binding response OmpR family regulator
MSEQLPYGPPATVLLVENDILERVPRAALLRRQGFEVFEAADTAEAVTVLKKIAVDILISNVSLIDGEALVRLAHVHQPKTQIVWMAALQSPEKRIGTVTLH